MSVVLKFPVGYLDGLHVTPGTDTVNDVDIAAGQCRNELDVYNIVSSGTVTVAIDASGLNGLDDGVVAADQWYSIWIIARTDTGAVGGLFSGGTDEGALVFPANYDVARRVGYVRTYDDGGTVTILPFAQAPQSGPKRWWWYDFDLHGTPNTTLVSDGKATDWTDCPELNAGQDRIAPSAVRVHLSILQRPDAAGTGKQIKVRPDGELAGSAYRMGCGLENSDADRRREGPVYLPVSDNRKIEYDQEGASGASAGARVTVCGWEDSL